MWCKKDIKYKTIIQWESLTSPSTNKTYLLQGKPLEKLSKLYYFFLQEIKHKVPKISFVNKLALCIAPFYPKLLLFTSFLIPSGKLANLLTNTVTFKQQNNHHKSSDTKVPLPAGNADKRSKSFKFLPQ